MNETTHKSAISMITAYLLGCITFYIFVPFTGVAIAFLLDSGIDSFIIHNLILPIQMTQAKKFLFLFYTYVQPIPFSLLVLFLFTFVFTKYLSGKIIVNALVLTIGAISVDLLHNPNFDYFFQAGYEVDLDNILLWYICALISIKFAYVLRSKKINKNAQPGIQPDR